MADKATERVDEHPNHYVHGYDAVEEKRLGLRTAGRSAGFFLPHLAAGMRLLDCGCGPGTITVGLAEAVAPGEAIGIDVAAIPLEAARALAAERRIPNVRFEVASVYDLPFASGSFDAVFAHTLFLHLSEPLAALREMHRVLRPGGVVGICDDDHAARIMVPSTPMLDEVFPLWERVVRQRGGDPRRARHHRRLLQEAGFVRCEGYATVGAGGDFGTSDRTHFAARALVNQLAEPQFVADVIGRGWVSREALDAMIAAVHAWGEQPDAFLAFLACAAVGWRESRDA